MIITNRHNLPDAVYKALSTSKYVPGASDYSVTTILKPPRIVQLERRFWDVLEEDVIDRVWSLFGSAAHGILEDHGCDKSMTEKRLYTEMHDRKVGGQIDHYLDGCITDYKVTSVWTLIYGSRFKEWEEQQNIYAYIFKQNSHDVERLQIVAILRDWDKRKASMDPNYPQTPIMIIPLNLWSTARQEAFISDRILLHKNAEDVPGDKLPYCSSSEVWQQDSQFALMKVGRKTAIKVERDFDKVEAYAVDNNYAELQLDQDKNTIAVLNKDVSIVERKGKRTRCESFCACARHCSQYAEYLREQSYA